MGANFSLKTFSLMLMSASLLPYAAFAQQSSDLVLNVYNNMGLVLDTREIMLKKGLNEVAFEGVSSAMRPETALFSAPNINVLEQNYDYNLLNANNIMEAYVGKKVKTVWQNPKDGKSVFDQATLLSNVYGKPVLQFDYGIETDFPGRVVYENLPENLREKPTLLAKIESKDEGKTPLKLSYLTSGISWRADYMAEMVSDKLLNLKTWVYLKNDTGADFVDAKINLVSGNVNSSYANDVVRPMMMNRMAKAEVAMAADAGGAVMPESVSDYHIYHLPFKTSLKDKQAKQLSLMSFENVPYEKEYVFASPLYFNFNAQNAEFKSLRPDIVVKIKNTEEAHLGEPLPQGKVRFYESDKTGNLLFVGEDDLSAKAKGDELKLALGKAFDVYAQGKISSAKQIAKDVFEYDVEVDFYNTSDDDKQAIFKQNIYNSFSIVSENVKSEKENSSTPIWRLDLPKNSQKKLTFKIRSNR